MLTTEQRDTAVVQTKPLAAPSFTEVQLSHLRNKANAGGSCHAVRYRLRAPIDLINLREKFEKAIRLWQSQQADQDTSGNLPRIWMETVSGTADSPIAERQRNAELTRPVEILHGPPCRAVLLQYQDRTADFIVVAHRAVLSHRALLWIAGAPFQDALEPDVNDVLAGSRVDCEQSCGGYRDELLKGNYESRPDWGMGNEKNAQSTNPLCKKVEFKEGISAASFLASVGLVLARYSGSTRPVIAALAASPDGSDGTGVCEGVSLLPFVCEADTTAGELLSGTAQRLSSPAWYTASLAGELANNCENRGEVLAGVYYSADCNEPPGGVAPDEYVACLAPPFPLTITCVPAKDGSLQLTCWFRCKEFADSVAAQFVDSVLLVHQQLRSNPGASLASIDLLSEQGREKVTALARADSCLEVSEERIETVFSRRAREHPEKKALSCGEDGLTYREVEQRSNRMAHALRTCGVRDGDRVGVCLERSLELVEALLAILKAGATYVPIDPAYPAERMAYTISDARISVVIASGKHCNDVENVRVVQPRELLRLVPGGETAPPSTASGHDPAYVIYTSGSTGRPKGVVVPHQNVLSLIAATTDDFGLSANDTWTLFHSSAFDFSVWEIWGCLLTGGHLAIAPYWVTRNSEEFAELLAKERVTVLNQTPSAFAQLLDVDREHPLTSSLRLVIFGGEQLDARMLLPWFDRHPEFECRMVNMFGITETTVHVTLETITREDALKGSKSVGHAMPGWYYYVMDPEGRPVPPGVCGEIYVGGAGVAQYYLNRPDLTAQRFVPDPYTGSRVYRSGDKGRLRPDGRLEHLGRLDTQVKIRGFRIELDEIRSVLMEAPGVHTAAVVVHKDDPRDPATAKLCAYVVLNSGHVSEIRSHVSRILPEYMVPSALIEMAALPLTHNGKLDASRLPAPSRNGHRNHTNRTVPVQGNDADALTKSLLHIWETVLGVQVGLDDNFFDLGGNSLYAMRIATAMRTQGLPPLPVRELYVQQTVRRLGASLQR